MNPLDMHLPAIVFRTELSALAVYQQGFPEQNPRTNQTMLTGEDQRDWSRIPQHDQRKD